MDANRQDDVNAAAIQQGDSKRRLVKTRSQLLSFEEMKSMYPWMSEKDLYRSFRDGMKVAVVKDKKKVQQISKKESS